MPFVEIRSTTTLEQARTWKGKAASCLDRGHVFVGVTIAGDHPCLHHLSMHETDISRAQGYNCVQDRRNFLTGRALLNQLVYQGHCRELAVDGNGKPMPHRGLHFNLSHSARFVAIGVARSGPIGVDVEAADGFPRNGAALRRVMHPNERSWVNASHDACERLRRELRLWTRKEAFGKMRGTGLSFELASIDMAATIDQPDSVVAGAVLITHFASDGEWMLSVAVEAGELQ